MSESVFGEMKLVWIICIVVGSLMVIFFFCSAKQLDEYWKRFHVRLPLWLGDETERRLYRVRFLMGGIGLIGLGVFWLLQ